MHGCVVAVSDKVLSKQLAHSLNKEAISQVHMIRKDADSLAAGSFPSVMSSAIFHDILQATVK